MRRKDFRLLGDAIGRTIAECRKKDLDPEGIWMLVTQLDLEWSAVSDTYCSKKFVEGVSLAIAKYHPAFTPERYKEAGAFAEIIEACEDVQDD